MKKIVIILAFIVLTTGITNLANGYQLGIEPKVGMPHVRAKGMGNAFTAVADDDMAGFYNPAGYSNLREFGSPTSGYWTFFRVGVNFVGTPWGFVDRFDEYEELIDDIEEDIYLLRNHADFIDSEINQKYVVGGDVLDIGYAGKIPGTELGIGVKMFAYADVFVPIYPNGFLIVAEGRGVETSGFLIGASHPLRLAGRKLTIGANFKYFHRMEMIFQKLGPTKALLMKEDIEDTLEVNPILAGYGQGIDLGALYEFSEEITLGLAITDFGGTPVKYKEYIDVPPVWGFGDAEPINGGRTITKSIPTSINIGGAYVFKRLPAIPTYFISDLTIAVDLKDINNFETHFSNKLHIGAEASFLGGFLPRLVGTPIRVRLGLNQGYPTVGCGLTFGHIVWVDMAYWKDELGYKPGQLDQENFGMTLKFML